MAKKIKGASPSEPLEDLDLDADLDAGLPPVEDAPAPASRIDATVNLDEYGIWVKGEPEDFKQVDSFDEQETGLEDLSPEEPGGGGKPESGGGMIDDLDIPEEESLSELEVPGAEPGFGLEEEPAALADTEAPALEMEAIEPILEEEAPEGAPTLDEEPTLEMNLGGEMPSLEEETPALDEEIPALDEEIPAAADDEISLDETFGSLAEDSAEEETALREEPEAAAPEPEAGLIEETEPGAAGDYEEVSLDDLGIEISAEPPEEVTAKVQTKRQAPPPPPPPKPAAEEAGPHVIDDEFASLSLDLESDGEAGAPAGEKGGLELEELELPEEEPLEPSAVLAGGEDESPMEESFDLTGPEGLEEIPELELGAEEPAALDVGADDSGEEIEVPLSDDVSIAESEEELGSLEAGPAAAAETGASSSILKNIEAELKSIKSELTQLKSELGMLRGRKPGEEESRKPGQAGRGAGGDFFEEEEDETIALTGEELDNILTTADIKEEAKAESAAEEAGEPGEIGLELGDDVIGYDEEPSAEISVEPPAGASGEISLDETDTDRGIGSGEGEIEIEIPELETGPEEILADGGTEEFAPIEDLGAEEGIEAVGAPAPSLEDTLEEVGELELESEPAAPVAPPRAPAGVRTSDGSLPSGLKEEIKSVLGYMDQLLESLPEEKIEEFAKSEYFSIYKKLFEELGLVS